MQLKPIVLFGSFENRSLHQHLFLFKVFFLSRCVLPMNTDTTLCLPIIPLLMSSGREFVVTSIPPNGVEETAQITPLMRLKVVGWVGGGSGEPSHCRRNQWRRAPVAAANVSVVEASPPTYPLQAGQPINCTWTHRSDSREKVLFHTL